ncbi:DUF3152 domain-containing protein [Amycolatopsis sp. NPDC005232]|uniref:DUF3152 domain-containing protein n=1 Tax=Amycolatopsis sp. NPDC005232 TaxID=3157027 RepID=UPI0033A49BB8
MAQDETRAREPLRASWKPLPERRSARRKKGFLHTYGWRVYALPVMVVVTVLVLVNTATTSAPSTAAQQQAPAPGHARAESRSESSVDSLEPGVPENPAKPADPNAPTADLPAGGPYTQAGRGKWHVIPGSGPKIGTGRLYRYTVEVEDGIDPASYAGDDSFATAVQGILSDPKSWTADGKVALQRVDASDPHPDFRVSLSTPDTTHRADACGFSITYEASCFRRSMRRVLINLSRWVRGAKAYGANMTAYRQYAINHEVGHALGHSHVGCGGTGQPAPVMMQQTFGVADDYVARLNNVPGGDQGAVPADHRVCATNSWPFP